jgi:hypothetical protein
LAAQVGTGRAMVRGPIPLMLTPRHIIDWLIAPAWLLQPSSGRL